MENKKLIRYYLICTAILLVGIIITHFHNARRNDVIIKSNSDALRKAEQEYRAAQANKEKEIEKTIAFLKVRDSINSNLLTNEIIINRNEIKKSRDETNKKITAISAFNSAEIRRAFSELK